MLPLVPVFLLSTHVAVSRSLICEHVNMHICFLLRLLFHINLVPRQRLFVSMEVLHSSLFLVLITLGHFLYLTSYRSVLAVLRLHLNGAECTYCNRRIRLWFHPSLRLSWRHATFVLVTFPIKRDSYEVYGTVFLDLLIRSVATQALSRQRGNRFNWTMLLTSCPSVSG